MFSLESQLRSSEPACCTSLIEETSFETRLLKQLTSRERVALAWVFGGSCYEAQERFDGLICIGSESQLWWPKPICCISPIEDTSFATRLLNQLSNSDFCMGRQSFMLRSLRTTGQIWPCCISYCSSSTEVDGLTKRRLILWTAFDGQRNMKDGIAVYLIFLAISLNASMTIRPRKRDIRSDPVEVTCGFG